MGKQIEPNKDPEYWENTIKCLHCYGRGRVPREGCEFREGTDTWKRIYEEEQAVAEAERIIEGCGGS